MKKTAFHFSVVLIVFSSAVFSGTTGKIAGKVVESETGDPMIGCNILVEGSSLGAATDYDGNYYIINVPPGEYTLKAMMIGYSTTRMTQVEVAVDLTTQVDFSLATEVIKGQEITVVAEKKMINKDLTASTAVINSDDFELLPVTEISEALGMQAGYVDGHLRGGRKGEVAYWIDGVPVTDAYDGETVVDVNKNAVEEMQLISGAFNAEYGQAMSGIVNIVTKDGSNDFTGNVSLYCGDFISQHNDIFLNVNEINMFSTRNVEGSVQGSIIPEKLFYYLNGRFIHYKGIYEGQRRYRPHSLVLTYQDLSGEYQTYIVGGDPQIDSLVVFSVLGSDAANPIIFDSTYALLKAAHPNPVGDNAYVPMDWNEKLYGQAKLVFKLSPLSKIKYTYIRDNVDYQEYDRAYKYNPDGILDRNRNGTTQLLQLHHSFGSATFMTLGVTQFKKNYSHSTYPKSEWGKLVHPALNVNEAWSFNTFGTNNQIFNRTTITRTLKVDITSQLNRTNMIKGGFEIRNHDLQFSDRTLQPTTENLAIDPFFDGGLLGEVEVMPDSTIYSSSYQFKPEEYSWYIQDKIELKELIINVGFRYDYFDPKGRILTDSSDPSIYNPIRPENRYEDLNNNGIKDEGEPSVSLNDRKAYWYTTTKSKSKISPRLGVSFPFTDQGVIHFSYGHFFQIPRFEYLYQNPDFDLGQGTGNVGVIGNADLRPEKTVSGELGLQQQIGPNLTLDLTGYFRDIRDLTGTRADQISMFGGAASYSKLVNSDFAYVRGVVFSLTLLPLMGWSGNLDYTYQIARGSASDPNQAQEAIAGGNLPEVQLIPLNWDQTHTINGSVSYSSKYYGASAIGRIGSGLPYTPESVEDISTLVQNSARKPVTWNVDLRAYYTPPIFSGMTVFLRIFNLFDHLNHNEVYDDSGVADETIDILRAKNTNPTEVINSIDEWFLNATHFSNPRRVEIGVSYAF